jgi:tight adherence protein B
VRARVTLAASLAIGAAGLALVFGLPVPFACAGSLLVGVALYLVSGLRARSVARRLEEDLASAIDLARSALRSGASPVDALARAARESRAPLRGELEALVARLRTGEPADRALQSLRERIPLESFALFALALGAQWGGGGSLERALAQVSHTLRERIELLRRLDAQAAPTRVSVAILFAACAVIAALSWSHDPVNVGRFLANPVGRALVSGSIALQALSLLWMWRLEEPRV